MSGRLQRLWDRLKQALGRVLRRSPPAEAPVPAPEPEARATPPARPTPPVPPPPAAPEPPAVPPPPPPPPPPEHAAPEGPEAPEVAMLEGEFSHQGRHIDYRLFVPPSAAAAPRALLLMLHGCAQDPLDFATGTRMNRLAAEHGVLVLYPAQAQAAHSHRCWNWFKPQHQRRGFGEPALLATLVQQVAATYAVPEGRAWVAGLSAGGAMADTVSQAYPELFAAVGIHSGLAAGAAHTAMTALAVMQNGPPGGLSPTLLSAMRTPLPTIVFHGDIDATVHPRNAERIVAAAVGATTAEPRWTEAIAPGGLRFTQSTFAAAEGRPAVEQWIVYGAGHAWSGGSADGTFTEPGGPDASAEMLRFFLAHTTPSP